MRILSHNVYWFQGVPFDTDQPGPPNSTIVERLAKMYADLKADVLCVQELQSQAAFEALSNAVRMAGVYLPGGILTQYGGGLLYRTGTRAADSSSASDPAQRVWQVVDVPFGGDAVRVANVHLPSARQLGAEAAKEKRVAEIQEVLEHRPDVVGGDWNEAPGGPLTERMRAAGYVDAAVEFGQNDVPSGLGGKRGDQIWVLESRAGHLEGYGSLSAEDLQVSDLNSKHHLSDHLPIWIDLEDA